MIKLTLKWKKIRTILLLFLLYRLWTKIHLLSHLLASQIACRAREYKYLSDFPQSDPGDGLNGRARGREGSMSGDVSRRGQAMTDRTKVQPATVVYHFPVEVEEKDGLFFVTSPLVRGLLVAERSEALALKSVPGALDALAWAKVSLEQM